MAREDWETLPDVHEQMEGKKATGCASGPDCACYIAGRAEGERKERLLLDSLDRQDSVHNEELTALRAENARLLDLCVAWEKRHHDRILERDAAEQREKRLRARLREVSGYIHGEHVKKYENDANRPEWWALDFEECLYPSCDLSRAAFAEGEK